MMHRAGLAPAREAEAYALLQALRWVEELDIQRVMFECDAKEVVDGIRDRGADETEFGDLIHSCISILDRHPEFSVVHVRRSGNTAAHTLARQSRLFGSPTVGVTPPEWLDESLLNICFSRH
ncbi:hypothetical protein LINPERHAP2_LOCUS13779 [Linum perenne]